MDVFDYVDGELTGRRPARGRRRASRRHGRRHRRQPLGRAVRWLVRAGVQRRRRPRRPGRRRGTTGDGVHVRRRRTCRRCTSRHRGRVWPTATIPRRGRCSPSGPAPRARRRWSSPDDPGGCGVRPARHRGAGPRPGKRLRRRHRRGRPRRRDRRDLAGPDHTCPSPGGRHRPVARARVDRSAHAPVRGRIVLGHPPGPGGRGLRRHDLGGRGLGRGVHHRLAGRTASRVPRAQQGISPRERPRLGRSDGRVGHAGEPRRGGGCRRGGRAPGADLRSEGTHRPVRGRAAGSRTAEPRARGRRTGRAARDGARRARAAECRRRPPAAPAGRCHHALLHRCVGRAGRRREA